MSEHIVDTTDYYLGDKVDLKAIYGPRLREEIIRCLDCEFYVDDPDPIDPGWPKMCEDTGRDMLEPDGFCSWAERRTDG